MTKNNYKVYRLINGEEIEDFDTREAMVEALGEMVLVNSYTSYSTTELDSDTLVVDCQ